MAKVIELYKRQDWKPRSEWVPVRHNAKVIMFPKQKIRVAVAGVQIPRIAPSLAHYDRAACV
jgi:hypothetical protein